MTITQADILTPEKRWSARAWINGESVSLADLPARTLTSLRGRATATLTLRDMPPTQGGLPVVVDLILDEQKVIRFFTGKTDQVSAASAALTRQVNVIDQLDLTRALPAAITWSSRSFVDAVGDLLADAGVSADAIDSIYNPGGDYALGVVEPIIITTTESIGQILGELMAFGGTALVVTPTGRVRVIDSPGVPAETSSIVYARSANRALGELGIVDAGTSIEGNETLTSVYTATGPRLATGAMPDGTFTASGLVGRPESRQYRFAQTDAVCLAIARRELGRRARARRNLWFEASALNPLLQPGMTILLRDAAIGLPENTPAIVTEAAIGAEGGMRVQVSIGRSEVDGFGVSNPPPVVDFALQVERQPVVIGGVEQGRNFVQVVDQSRDPLGLPLASRSWTASGPGATPSSSTAPAPLFFFSDLVGATITLTVTAQSGESASLTRTIATPDSTVLNRTVQIAAGAAGWRVLDVSGWRSWTGAGSDCTAVAPYNATSPLWAGFASGAIYRSSTLLATAPALLITLTGGGPVHSIFINEGNAAEVLAAHGLRISRSRDGGASWSVIRTFEDAPALDLASNPTEPDEIVVAAGRFILTTIRLGGGFSSGFSPLIEGASGSTARGCALAPWGHIAGVFADVSSAADAVRIARRASGGSIELMTVSWDGISPPSAQPLGGLLSVTPLAGEEAFLVGECAGLVRDDTLSSLVLTAATASGARLYKLTRSGLTSYTATLLEATAPSGPGKLINQASSYPLDTSGAALRIGYGPLRRIEAADPLPPITRLSTLTGTRALQLGAGDPPASWEALAFDDTSWAAAVSYTDWPANNTLGVVVGAPGRVADDRHLIRHAFTLPVGSVNVSWVRLQAEDYVASVYVNGTLIGSTPPYGAGVSPTVYLIIPPAVLRTGGLSNVLAIDLRNDSVAAMGVAWSLEINLS